MKKRTGNTLPWLKILALVHIAVFSCQALAQQYFDPGIMQRSISQMPRDYQAEGVRLGSFVLSPGVELAYENHDNIYYENEGKTSDTIFHLRPRVELVSGWSRHSISIGAEADFARFGDAGMEDYDDLALTADARIDVKRGKYFSLRAATMSLHEERSSPEDPGGIEPTGFTQENFSIGYHHVFNRLTAGLSFGTVKTDYDNNFSEAEGFIDNRDRDRSQDTATLHLDYQVAPQRSVYLDLSTNTVDYDLLSDDAGFVRSGDGFRVQGGVTFDITGVLTGSAWLEYLEQDYDDPRFSGIDDTGFGMGLNWSPTRLTNVDFRVERTPLETTQEHTSGYLGTIYSVRLQHELRRFLLFHARVSYTDNDYSLTPQAPASSLSGTQVSRAGIGLSYLFNRNVQLTAGYTREKQDANLVLDQFDSNRFFLILGWAL